jgi:hypothetical protein
MKKRLFTLAAIGAVMLGTSVAFAQSSSYLLPYGMSAGMSVLNRAMQPRPVAAPTPAAPETAYSAQAGGYGAQIGDRRLVCEQWTGNRWVVIHVAARQCQP